MIRIVPITVPPALQDIHELDHMIYDDCEYRNGCFLNVEGWLEELFDEMQQEASDYAETVLGTVAVNPSQPYLTKYKKGNFDVKHIDQYENRGNHPDTINRTVSGSLILRKADEGGAMVFQDYHRTIKPVVANPEPGNLILFPADWWHEVAMITKGTRNSLVTWWQNDTGERFRSA